jgi:hypothetical protein
MLHFRLRGRLGLVLLPKLSPDVSDPENRDQDDERNTCAAANEACERGTTRARSCSLAAKGLPHRAIDDSSDGGLVFHSGTDVEQGHDAGRAP